jgi:arsenate reductase
MKMKKLNILFLCTGNSCRSQMAEGWTKKLKSDVLNVWSAGIETHGLNPYAVQVMKEAGVDISTQHSKNINELLELDFDYVITVCDHAHETCPVFPKKACIVHAGFDDPPALAAACSVDGDKLDCYRKVRDQIRRYVETLPDALPRTDEICPA